MLEKLKRVNAVNLIVSVFFLGGWYFLYSNIRLAADDYMYAFFSENALASTWHYYFVGNGRFFINLIESFLLKFDRYALIVIIPPAMLALAALISKLVNMLSGYKSKYIYVVSLTSLAAMDVLLAQEVFYWLSGAVTYLFSSVMFVASIIIFLHLKQNPDLPKGKKVGLIILCVVCAFAMEQFALMTTGFIFFALVYELITTKKIKKLHILVFALCAAATLSSLLAPASLVRLGDNSSAEAGGAASLINSVMDAIFFNYSSSSAIRFVAVISLLAFVISIKNKRKLLTVASGLELIVTGMMEFANFESFVLVLFGLIIFLIATVGTLITVADNKETAFYTISLLVLSYMSQVFMLVDNLHHNRIYRISYTVVIVYIVLVAYLVSRLKDVKAASAVFILLLAFISTYAMSVAVLTFVVFSVFVKNDRLNMVAMGVISLAVISWSLIPNAMKLDPYAKLVDYNEAQLSSGNKEIVIHCVREENMDVIYYPDYLVRISEDNLSPDGGYYKKFCGDYDGSIFRHYYGLGDDQTVRIEYIEGDVRDFLESVGY